MSVISNRESTDYIPFGCTASSMSSSARYSAVQTRTARRKAADRMKRLDELRLKQLKAKCALEISNLELDIMERTIHSEVCDEEETDSHYQMSVPLLGQVDGSSHETIPHSTSAYVNLPATGGETRGQQSPTEIHSYSVPAPHTASILTQRKFCSDPPRLNQPGMASTPLNHGNTAMAAEVNFEIPSRDADPATSHVSYDEPRVLPPAAQPAGANVHAQTWIPAQPGYMSTTSAVPHSDIHPPVSIPCNDMTSRNRNFQYSISHPTHVTDLSSTNPELSNRDVRNTIMERDRNELSNIDVYDKMAAAMRDSLSLPKPELLTFDGSSRMYMQFMRNFECNIANRVPDYRLKLQYLIQYCNAEVQNYISSCIIMEPKEGYHKAIEILATRYGSPHVVQRSYLKKVLDGAQLRPSDSKGLSDLAHDMQQCSIALKSLGYKCDLDSGETLLKISRRFPNHVRSRWIRESSKIINQYNRDPTFEEMTSYILEEAKIANTMFGQDFYSEATRDQKPVCTTMRQADNLDTRIKATTLVTRDSVGDRYHKEMMCSVCDEDSHPVWKCDKFVTMCTDDRKQLVKANKWCSNCFSKKHVVTDCHHQKKLCNRRECEDSHKHNTLLCLASTR